MPPHNLKFIGFKFPYCKFDIINLGKYVKKTSPLVVIYYWGLGLLPKTQTSRAMILLGSSMSTNPVPSHLFCWNCDRGIPTSRNGHPPVWHELVIRERLFTANHNVTFLLWFKKNLSLDLFQLDLISFWNSHHLGVHHMTKIQWDNANVAL